MKRIENEVDGRKALDYLMEGYSIREYGDGGLTNFDENNNIKYYKLNDLPTISDKISDTSVKWAVFDEDKNSYTIIESNLNFFEAVKLSKDNQYITRESWDDDRFIKSIDDISKLRNIIRNTGMSLEDLYSEDWLIYCDDEDSQQDKEKKCYLFGGLDLDKIWGSETNDDRNARRRTVEENYYYYNPNKFFDPYNEVFVDLGSNPMHTWSVRKIK